MCKCAWQQPCATANPGFRPAAEVRGAGGAIGAVVAAYAPGGDLGAAHHDDDVIAGIWSDAAVTTDE